MVILTCFMKIGIILGNVEPAKVNPLNANPEKWSNTLKQIVGNLPTICLSVFDHFMNLVKRVKAPFSYYLDRQSLSQASRELNNKLEICTFITQIFRSSYQRCSMTRNVIKNLAIFTGKHVRWSLFF